MKGASLAPEIRKDRHPHHTRSSAYLQIVVDLRRSAASLEAGAALLDTLDRGVKSTLYRMQWCHNHRRCRTRQMCMRRRCHIGSAMNTCLRGQVAACTASAAHDYSSSARWTRGCFACSPATAQLAPSRGVCSSPGGSSAAQRVTLSRHPRIFNSARMERRRRIAPAASAATDAPPVAERLTGADAEQWSAAVEEVMSRMLHQHRSIKRSTRLGSCCFGAHHRSPVAWKSLTAAAAMTS